MLSSLLHPSPLSHRPQSGSVLVLVVIFSTVLIVMVSALLQTTVMQARHSHRNHDTQQAIALAEAGIERAINSLNAGNWTGWALVSGNRTRTETVADHYGVSVGTFIVSVSNPESSSPEINSIGTVPRFNLSRAVRVQTSVGINTGPSFYDWAIFAYDWLTFSSNGFIDSYRSDDGPYGGSNTGDQGNLGGADGVDIDVASNIEVHGRIQTGGSINGDTSDVGDDDPDTQNIITGDSGTAPPPFPDDDLQAAKDNSSNTWDDIVFGGDSDYDWVSNRELKVGSHTTITMPPGDYYFSLWEMGSNCQVIIDPPGDVRVYFETGSSGDPTIKWGSNNDINRNGVPAQFQTFVKTGTVNIQSDAYANMTVFAPNSAVEIQSTGDFYGAVVGGQVTIQSDLGFHYDENLSGGSGTGASNVEVESWMEVDVPAS